MKNSIYGIGILLLILLTSCNNTRHGVVSYRDNRTECMGSELDGSYTVRAWGYGRYVNDAKEQAKKTAVYDILFKGVSAGRGGCEQKPMLLEVNAETKYKAYFDRFFADNGEYLNYISMKDRRPGSWQHARQKGGIACSLVVRVKYSELRQHLIDDGILKTSF
ncbi:hypothetical protein HDR65_02485 [bacterium]|nr:hypothetical protein [bacterium]